MPNRLAGETSPYLRQHAANPVDWYPWGDEALGEARARDKPILLSIGYSSCHWCHVMERESFENEETARLMNENFVNIKVDREERPDLDHIYMEAVQAITGRGGWPLTVFLTPAGDAYFGGTYFPPQDVHGLPSFRKILIAAAEAYRSERTSIQKSADAVRSYLEQLSYQKPQAKALSDDVLKRACSKLSAAFDKRNGGFGEAPRFPQPMVLEFLLRYHLRMVAARRAVPAADRRAAPAAERMALEMVETSLERMARGGIYDQLGGGFHRYSTDAAWLVPHFEKMLYDNALLSRVYLHAYQVTAKPLYRSIAEGTLEYVLREMTAPGGGFCSAQDADTEGEEGKYYLWTPAEIEDALGSEQAGMVSDYFGVTGPGNYEGKNVLHVAGEGTLPAPAVDGLLEDARSRLLAYRERRVRPGRDDKVLAGWNGLMMASLAQAGRALGEKRYVEAARRNASFVLDHLWKNGKLWHTYSAGESKVPAFLEDYASAAGGLLSLYEATLEPAWLAAVLEMAPVMVGEFWDGQNRVFFDSAGAAPGLVVRPRNMLDNALPCGSSQATGLFLRLGRLTGDSRYHRIAVSALESVVAFLSDQPLGFGHWLCALDFHLSQPLELAIAGAAADSRTQALLQVIHDRYIPNRVVAGIDDAAPPAIAALPLLEGRSMKDGAPTAYLCHQYRCLAPVTSPEDLRSKIQD